MTPPRRAGRALRLGAFVHRGVVEAAGFLLDPALCGEAEARRRVLALWSPGLAVYRSSELSGYLGGHRGGARWLVLLPQPRRVEARLAPGLALVRDGDLLLGLPLPPAVRARLAATREAGSAVVFAERGGLTVWRPAEGERLEPAAWLDAGAFAEIPVASLGAPPAPPRLELPRPAAWDARRSLPQVQPPVAELAQMLAALSQGGAGRPAAPPWWAGWARRFLDARGGMALAAGAGVRPVPRAAPRRPSRLGLALDRLLARALVSSRLAAVFGRRQAVYIQRMMELFEHGDFEQALRHAIPLSPEASGDLSRISWGLPQPRERLAIGLAPRGASSLALGGDDLYRRLQALYRQAFDRLTAEGRIEEATFILAEVLRADAEAVAFLERHGRLRLAAELAEARGLSPAVVVRQWFLAGDRARAVLLARRGGAFALAVSLLERGGKAEEAKSLRLLWGHDLASGGAYAAAVEAVAPLAEGRGLAVAWIERAVEQGGEAGARALARALAFPGLDPARYHARAVALLAAEESEGIGARLAFAESLRRHAPEDGGAADAGRAVATLARAAVRAVLRDAPEAPRAFPPAAFRGLVALAGDGALKADARPHLLARPRPWSAGREPLRLAVAAGDTGARAIHDAAFLPNGSCLVALGEGGVALLTRDGRQSASFDTPAHRLVVADSGDRAIACVRRGEIWVLARLDLLAKTARAWGAAPLAAFAPSYDGVLWFVASADGVAAVEAREARFVASWGVPEAVPAFALARSAERLSFLTAGREIRRWSYELPSLTLREREALAAPLPAIDELERPLDRLAVSAEGRSAASWVGPLVSAEGEPGIGLHLATDGRIARSFSLPAGEEWSAGRPALHGAWLAAAAATPAASRLFVGHAERPATLAEVTVERPGRLALRLTETTLTLADERGRLLVLELESGRLLRDLRV